MDYYKELKERGKRFQVITLEKNEINKFDVSKKIMNISRDKEIIFLILLSSSKKENKIEKEKREFKEYLDNKLEGREIIKNNSYKIYEEENMKNDIIKNYVLMIKLLEKEKIILILPKNLSNLESIKPTPLLKDRLKKQIILYIILILLFINIYSPKKILIIIRYDKR